MSNAAQITEAQRHFLQQKLQSQLVALEVQSRARLEGQSQAEHARQVLLQDADDATQQDGAHEVEGTVSDIGSLEFEALRSALQRIRGPTYGVCAECGVAIPFDRLSAEPQAVRCLPCATRQQHQEQRMA
jgi:DnaK suppressor protein